MNDMVKNRAARRSSLPTALLMLVLGTGFASVGQAQDIAQTQVTAKKSSNYSLALRNEMQARARRAVWDTRISVATDLYARLHRQHHRSLRLAGGDSGYRG